MKTDRMCTPAEPFSLKRCPASGMGLLIGIIISSSGSSMVMNIIIISSSSRRIVIIISIMLIMCGRMPVNGRRFKAPDIRYEGLFLRGGYSHPSEGW